MKKCYLFFALLLSASSAFSQLIINEVLYDPSNSGLDGDANGDGSYDQEEDSFIEFVNISNTNFDASGYQIWDDTTSGSLKYVVPAGTWVPPNGALVIFGGGTLSGSFGNAVVLKTDSVDGMNLNNSGEVIVIKDNTGKTVLTFDSDALSNNPNESYTRYPDITGSFLQHGDTTSVLFSPGTMTDGTPFDTVFVVSEIMVQGANGDTTITVSGGTLQMEAMVMPTFADDTTVVWSVPTGNSVATISASGLLTATGNGTVWVRATANDIAAVSDSIEITISNQGMSINEYGVSNLTIFPNPAKEHIQIKGNFSNPKIEVLNLSGQVLMQLDYNKNGMDISMLKTGVYILKVSDDSGLVTSKFNKL